LRDVGVGGRSAFGAVVALGAGTAASEFTVIDSSVAADTALDPS
jgi:hypothetical protein